MTPDEHDRIPLETDPSAAPFDPPDDRRPVMPEPLPVRLVAVADVRLPAPPDARGALDAFYVGLLGCEPAAPPPRDDANDAPPPGPAYQFDNFKLIFEVRPRPVPHEKMRPQTIVVRSLPAIVDALLAAEMPHTRERSLTPGRDALVLLDPAGNWVELVERREIF